MDFLKAQAAKIREQLAGLSPSQRMLAGTLVVIMVMTLLWWSRYAGSSEMEELLPQDFSAEDVARITAMIDSRGIPRKLNGNRIQVAADRRLEVLGMLTYEQIGPRDTSSGWDEVVQKMNSPWNPDKVQDIMFNRAKEASLAQVMREWPGVRDARVIINNAQRRAFGEANVAPSATVNIKMRNPGEKAPRRLIAAAADTVSGAVAGMQWSNVKVIVDGASYTLEDPGQGGAGGESWVERVKEHELYYYQKIQERLSKIDGVMVSVSVDLKADASQIETETYDKEKTFPIPLSIDEKNDESNTTSRPPSEPGAVPNTGSGANQGATLGNGAPGGGGGEGTSSTTTDSKVKNQIFPSVTRKWTKSPAGMSNVIGASVGVPRSYFVKIFKMANPTAKDPDDTALTPLVDSESRRIKNAVMGCVTQNTPEEKVLVDMYWDFVPASETAGGQPAVATSIPLALSGHVKEIALGGLALLSLFMVSMMVRKTTPPAIVVPKAEKAQAAAAEVDLTTEVSEGIQSMDAVEVNDDSVRTQQIIGQVSNMVKENPDAAANLVKRWLNRA